MGELRTIVERAVPLAVMEAASLILALVTLTFLTRTLGPAGFGQYAFGVAAALTLTAVIDYGFNQLGPKDIARADPNARARAAVLWPIQRARAMLAAFALPTAAALAWLSNLHETYGQILLAAAPAAISALAFPQWFLQGTLQNKTLASSLALGRLVTAAATLALIRHPDDAPIAVALQALTGLWAGVFALRESNYAASVRLWRERGRGPVFYIKQAWPLFVSCAAVTTYSSGVPLVLGVTSPAGAVAQFGLADRIRGAMQTLLVPVGISAFPRFSVLFRDDQAHGLRQARRMLGLQISLGLAAALVIAFAAKPLIRMVAGEAFLDAVPVAQVLGLCILFNGVSNTLGMQVMLPLGRERAFAIIFVATAACGLPLLAWASSENQALGAAWSLVATEALAAALMAAYLRWQRLL